MMRVRIVGNMVNPRWLNRIGVLVNWRSQDDIFIVRVMDGIDNVIELMLHRTDLELI